MKNLIGFYGDNIQSVVPNYLEQTLEAFVRNQENMRAHINKSFEGMNTMQGMFPNIPTPATNIEEMSRKNMEMFEQTMKMFMPFGADFSNTNAKDDNKK